MNTLFRTLKACTDVKCFFRNMSNLSDTLDDNTRHEPIPLVPFVVVLCFISLASMFGNCLVCIAIYQQPRLRTVMHYSMLSLGK